MMYSQSGQTGMTGPYGQPPPHALHRPPIPQMAGMSLGPPGVPPLSYPGAPPSSSAAGMYPGSQPSVGYGVPRSAPQQTPQYTPSYPVAGPRTSTAPMQPRPPVSHAAQMYQYSSNVAGMSGPPPPSFGERLQQQQPFPNATQPPSPPSAGTFTPPTGMGQAPTSMGMGQAPPSGMGMGQAPPTSMSMGQAPPSGMGMGQAPPSGMGMGQAPPSGMGMGQAPPSGMGMGHTPPSGMGMGPPPPSSMGMQSMGPAPGSGMGRPPPPGMGRGPTPPTGGFGQAPPTSMGMGPPTSVGMRPPAGMGMGPPTSMGMRPPAGMGMGPPTGMGMGPAQPTSTPMMMGQYPPSSGQMPQAMMAPPTNYAPPTSQPGAYGQMQPTPISPMAGQPPQQSFGGPPPPGGPMGGIYPGPQGRVGPGGPPPGSPGMATGPIQQQPRQRIDPDNMPNPVAVMKLDQDHWKSSPYLTSTRGTPPPLTSTTYTVQDDGNCSPRYMRATMYAVPCSKDLLNSCRIPMGLVVQPLAKVPYTENVLRLVDHGAQGPIRCNRCKAYMNPFARFIDGGRQYLCPICQYSNEVSPDYFSHLDHQGRRTDTLQRPELCYGSVEFLATKDYCKEGKLPRPPAYIFMIDVSFPNIQNGLLSLLSQTILTTLDNLPGTTDEGGSPIQVGFVTYDKSLHFYNIKASLTQPQMMVLTDIDDVFVPMVDGFLVNMADGRAALEGFLSQLPAMFTSSKSPQVVLEPAVRAGMEALKAADRNGRLFVFHSSLPTAQGPGMLKNREDVKLIGTDKEKTLLSPASSSYQKLAEDCVKFGVSVELFLFPSTYCDVATLAHLTSTTGGELHYYRNYQTNRDGDRLMEDLRHSVSRNTAFDVVMRVRASTGLRPTGFTGAFYMANTTDIELGNIDSDKAIAVEVKHDDKLREDDIAFFQAALLYTDFRGQRRLRVHNLALACSAKFQDIFRSCEIDTIMNFFAKSMTKASLTMSYKSIRETFTNQVAVILSCYRKQCSNQSPGGQLILPESLKLLPMYANCLLKSHALISSPLINLDEKCWLMSSVLSMDLQHFIGFLYPRVLALHDVDVESKDLPPVMRCTAKKFQDDGVYCAEDGFMVVIWVGQRASGEYISKVFGAASHAQINTDMHALPALDNPLSFRVRAIVSQLQSERKHCMKLVLTKQRDKTEVLFTRMMKEDKGAGQWEGSSYIDFLCQVHRDIKEILS